MAYGGIMGKGLPGNVLKSQIISDGEPLYTQVNIDLSTKNEGDIITLPEDGKNVEFYVAKKDYEPGLNGTGRALLVRKDVYPQSRQWDAGNVNAYATSDIDAWLHGPYKAMFPESIQTAMGTTEFSYTVGNGSGTLSTLERAVFILSFTELYGGTNSGNYEGTKLPDPSVFYGSFQWTRSPVISTNYAVRTVINASTTSSSHANTSSLFRPTFTLPNTFTYTYYVDSTGNAYEDQAYSDASYQFVNQAGIVMPIAQIETGSYVGTGKYGENNPNVLTFSFAPKLIIFASNEKPGSYYVIGTFVYNAPRGITTTRMNTTPSVAQLSWEDKTVKYYSTDNANYQLNSNTITYYYVAIG